jgi:hypothetical protein
MSLGLSERPESSRDRDGGFTPANLPAAAVHATLAVAEQLERIADTLAAVLARWTEEGS